MGRGLSEQQRRFLVHLVIRGEHVAPRLKGLAAKNVLALAAWIPLDVGQVELEYTKRGRRIKVFTNVMRSTRIGGGTRASQSRMLRRLDERGLLARLYLPDQRGVWVARTTISETEWTRAMCWGRRRLKEPATHVALTDEGKRVALALSATRRRSVELDRAFGHQRQFPHVARSIALPRRGDEGRDDA